MQQLDTVACQMFLRLEKHCLIQLCSHLSKICMDFHTISSLHLTIASDNSAMVIHQIIGACMCSAM